MSILNQPKPITPADRAANELKNSARQTFYSMVASFNNGSKNFWKNASATPEQIAQSLGADAKEIFELHAKLGALIASVKPEAIAEGSNIVGDFTINDDGTVTIVKNS